MLYFLYRVQSTPKLITSVHQSYFRSHIGQKNAPIQGRIATTGNNYFLITIHFRVLDHVSYTLILILNYILQRWLTWLKTSKSSSDSNDRRMMLCAFGGGYYKCAIFQFFNGFSPFP